MDHYSALTGYQVSAVMMTGAKTGLFRALGAGPAPAEEIAHATGLSARGTGALLRSLEALGYVAQEGGKYVLTAAGCLLNGTGADGLSRLAIKESFFYRLWANLDQSVRTGSALLPPFAERVKSDMAFVETFLLALNDLAEKSAAGFLGAARLQGVRRLLDFGGGAAGYSMIIARRYPEIEITLVDRPEIVPLARRVVQEAGLGERVHVTAGDVFAPGGAPGGGEFDAVLVSHLLHDFDAAAGKVILHNALALVRSGGRLIVNDVFTGAGPLKLPETFFDLMMLVENPGGAAHPLAEVRQWVSEAGWIDPTYEPLYFGGLLQARREETQA